MPLMILNADFGRNKHNQRVVLARCDCGAEFTPLLMNVKNGRTKTCGHCGKPAPKKAPEQPAPILAEQPSQFLRGTPQWFDEQIQFKLAAALMLEKQANELEQKMAKEGITNFAVGEEPADRKWNRAVTTAHKLRQQSARLETEKAKAETARKKDERTARQLAQDKIEALG
jgi:hypothetical protein